MAAAEFPPWQVVRNRADGRMYVQLGGRSVRYVTRRHFLERMWNYTPGEHVSVLGPTQIAGKSRLLTDLLAATDTGWCAIPPTMLVLKPSDPTITRAAARLHYSVVREWPPKPRRWYREEPPGYIFWPEHLRGVESKVNADFLRPKFSAAIGDLFWQNDTITVVDELYATAVGLDLHGDIDRHLTQGMGKRSGLWLATQKPGGTQRGGLSGFVWNSPFHTFITSDPDERNRVTYGDIGGISRKITEHATAVLPKYTFLYVYRDGPEMCVVGPK